MKYIITPEQSFPDILKPGMLLLAPGQCVKVLNAVVSWDKNPVHFRSAHIFGQTYHPDLYVPIDVRPQHYSDTPWPVYIKHCQDYSNQQTVLLDAINQPKQGEWGEWFTLYRNMKIISANLWETELCFNSYIYPKLLPTYEEYPEHFRPVAAKIERLWKQQQYYKQYIAPSMPTSIAEGML